MKKAKLSVKDAYNGMDKLTQVATPTTTVNYAYDARLTRWAPRRSNSRTMVL